MSDACGGFITNRLEGVILLLYTMLLPKWVVEAPDFDYRKTPPSIEGMFTEEEMLEYNQAGYNCYFWPNYPKHYDPEYNVDGSMIDTFTSVFVDLDMKDYMCENKTRRHEFATKESFIKFLKDFELPPSSIVDSGGGIHAYWYVSDLDPMGFLRLQRRMARYCTSDLAVVKLKQIMRVPGTINWKDPDNMKVAEWVEYNDFTYTSEDLDRALPKLTPEDEVYCQTHFDKTHGLQQKIDVSDELPSKWFQFAKKGTEPYRLFYGAVKDRSAADYRLAHLLYGAGFTKEEALAVLCQTNKATDRVGVHRYNYADNIVGKVYLVEQKPELKSELLTDSVRKLLEASPDDDSLIGKRFECDPIFDATEHGFRLTQVMGLIGGAGAGKTMFGFNIFRGFALRNRGYVHLAVSLEQPELEYAKRWSKMCKGNPQLLEDVHILGNYNKDGTYRHLSLSDIEDYVRILEKSTGKKVGSVMIDHIGVLKREDKNGDSQGLIDICQHVKAFAVNTNTFLIIQSQTSRDKAGIGDIELDKDAAYGTSNFEWFADYVVTLWQPLKRVYDNPACPLVTAFKFCKIRHKNVLVDGVKEDQRYALIMNPDTDGLRELTEQEHKQYTWFSDKATKLRNRDKKREPGAISVISWTRKEEDNGTDGRNADASRGSRDPK